MEQETNQEVKKESETTPTPAKSNNQLIVVLLVVACALFALYWFFIRGAEPALDTGVTDTMAETYNESDVVAIVNGIELTRGDMAASLAQTEQIAAQQGLDITDPSVRPQLESTAVNAAVNTELLLQAANQASVAVSSEVVDTELAAIQGQFESPEAFSAEVESLGLTADEVRDDVEEQLRIDAFIRSSEQFANVSVSDEDVETAYASVAAGNDAVPPLEEVRGVLEGQLLQQAQQVAISALIDSLRADAVIDIQI